MEVIEKIRKEIQPHLEGTNPCHDITHTERVLNLAIHIGKKEGANLEILELAALLHDVGRKLQDESKGKICHAEEGVRIAKEILKRQNYDQEKINKITHCIETHRFRDNKAPQSKEAKILYDADKLDSIGAIGIGRAFSFAGHLGALIHIPNIDIEKTQPYTKEDSANREFLSKLIKIKDKMLTEEGKRIAEERHHFMERFFNRIDKEYLGEL